MAFREGLRELGYVGGKNVTVVARHANADVARVPIVVQELIALPVDVLIVTPKAVQVAKEETATIPIVCTDMGNLVRDGLVASLAHPGSNLTDAYALATETNAKRLELITEVTPAIKSVAVMFDANDLRLVANAKALRTMEQSVGVTVHTFGVCDWKEIENALETMDRERMQQALMIFDNPLTELHLAAIMKRVADRLRVVSEGRDWVRAGALLTYGADYHDMWEHGAKFVDKILRGEVSAINWTPYITTDPQIMHIAVCFPGTRIPVSVVLDHLAAGETPERILAQYPTLKLEHIPAALGYPADLARERIVPTPA
jgi:putative ABC transport system substrate-binding protein